MHTYKHRYILFYGAHTVANETLLSEVKTSRYTKLGCKAYILCKFCAR